MPLISVLSLTSWSPLSAISSDVVAKIKRTERKIFPRNEASDFDTELSKRNAELVAVVEIGPAASQLKLVAYLVATRVHNIALLHKLCVAEEYRRRGIAAQLLGFQIRKLRMSNCVKVQLRVDEQREAARTLYSKVGFTEVDRVVNYYASERAGIKMVLPLLKAL